MSCLKKKWSCLRKSIWVWSGAAEESFFLNLSEQGTRQELILKRTMGTTAAQLGPIKRRGRWSTSLYPGGCESLLMSPFKNRMIWPCFEKGYDNESKCPVYIFLRLLATSSNGAASPLPGACNHLYQTFQILPMLIDLNSTSQPFFDSNSFRQLYPRYGSAMVWEYDQLLAKKPNRLEKTFLSRSSSGSILYYHWIFW